MAQLQFPLEASASSYSWRLLFGGLSYWFVKGQVQTFKSGSTALAASSLFVSPHDAYFFGLPMSDYCCYPICNSLYIVSILFSIYMYILYISTLFSKTHIRSNNPEHSERMWLRLSSSHHKKAMVNSPKSPGLQVKLRYMPVNWVSSEAIDAINQAKRCQVCGGLLDKFPWKKMWWVLKVFKACCMG